MNIPPVLLERADDMDDTPDGQERRRDFTSRATDIEIQDIDTVPLPSESQNIETLEASHRGWLAFGLLLLFVLTVALSFISLMWGPGVEATKGWLDLVLPAETALLGAGLAFYFATRK